MFDFLRLFHIDRPVLGHILRFNGIGFVNVAPSIDHLSDVGGMTAILTATETWNPGSVGADAYVTELITVTGVEEDDAIICNHSAITGSAESGWLMHGHYDSTDTVGCVLFNGAGTARTVGSGTLRATVFKF